MFPLRFIPLLLGLAVAGLAAPPEPPQGAFATGRYRNLFGELLGKSPAEADAKLAAAWQQFFQGDEQMQRLFYPVAGAMAYIPDVGNRDVRTEGLSYGMMICVQLDHQPEFNALWKFAHVHMYHDRGPLRGYFTWHTAYNGTMTRDDGSEVKGGGPAPDGEEWFVMALFFAAHRWGNGEGIFNYEAEAQSLLRTMLHKNDEPVHGEITPMFDAGTKQIVFVPDAFGAIFTDPSYHLPAFYELWARWAAAPEDRAFCAGAAAASRALFKRAAHPRTGLMPDYSEFDGRPHLRHSHEDFRYDAWRTLSNPALDYAWFAADPWAVEQSNRVLTFLAAQGPSCPDRFKLDGTPVSTDVNSPGLFAMAATAGLAADPAVARPFVQRLWDMEIPAGPYRYYNGLLYLIGLLEVGGQFRIHGPAAAH
jgi:oligosaccharide reducing-end xylanase